MGINARKAQIAAIIMAKCQLPPRQGPAPRNGPAGAIPRNVRAFFLRCRSKRETGYISRIGWTLGRFEVWPHSRLYPSCPWPVVEDDRSRWEKWPPALR